jgi:glycosyltransferase involved in cell wall biosynthesis
MIFLVAYGGGHVAMLAPIAAMLARASRPFTFLALTTARGVLERQGIPAIGFRDLPGADDPEVQAWGRKLASELPPGGPVLPEETIAYLGMNFKDLVHDVGETEAWKRYRNEGRQTFLPVRTMENALRTFKPSLVVATNSPRAEQAAIIAAGNLGIPSVCAVDLFALQEVQWIGKSGYADRVCVLNETVRRMFLSHDRKPDEVVVTGNPAFDPLTSPETIAAGKRLRRERGWDDGRRVVLWASQVEPERHPFTDRVGDPSLARRVETALRKIVAANQGLRLVVRYHPSERVNFEPAAHVDFSPASESISVLLHAVDAVVVTASTVGLEAAIAGRPVVSVDMSMFTPDTQYAELGVSKGINSLELLDQALNEALAGNSPGFTQGQTGMTGTQALLRVMDSLLV